MTRADEMYELAWGLVDMARECLLCVREVAITARTGLEVVRERRAAMADALRERVDELETRLRACEERQHPGLVRTRGG